MDDKSVVLWPATHPHRIAAVTLPAFLLYIIACGYIGWEAGERFINALPESMFHWIIATFY